MSLIEILPAPPPPAAPVFTAATPPATATVGAAYSYTFAATGNPTPTFRVSSGALPAGLGLNSTTGVLSGPRRRPARQRSRSPPRTASAPTRSPPC
ncbi:putative Ig domain-containing protein [Arthrobacter sp. ok909]|uniref:putative Ig domain-containing protein n=1 Tax=Arthrobacter sp. ok909 TaxID=1761746 RepID=UPI000B817A28|nr:putative Ig domain-containing protein [Arthrobacter sp. ok909]